MVMAVAGAIKSRDKSVILATECSKPAVKDNDDPEDHNEFPRLRSHFYGAPHAEAHEHIT